MSDDDRPATAAEIRTAIFGVDDRLDLPERDLPQDERTRLWNERAALLAQLKAAREREATAALAGGRAVVVAVDGRDE